MADEPTGALDSKNSSEIMELSIRLNQQGKTIIIITHDEKISKYANRIIKIEDGMIIQDEAKI